MPRFLVDTSVLLRSPEVLAKTVPTGTFLVPAAVLRELRGTRAVAGREQLFGLIKEAADRGSVEILDERTESAGAGRGLSADVAITMHLARHGGDDLILATEDRDLFRAAVELGVPVVDSAGLAAKLAAAPVNNQPLLDRARTVIKAQRRSLVLGIGVGVAITILTNLAATRASLILSTLHVWGTIVLLAVLAVFLYWFRGRYRLMYGSAELFVGFSASARAFWPRFSYAELNAAGALQVIAGLYVMVRGLDNVGKALEKTRWNDWWRRVFKE
jgi:rRNA-processing protein FCF1